MIKTVVKIMILIALALTLVMVGYWRASQSQMTGELQLPGLHQTVLVEFDRYASPKISAANETDVMMALGYLTARERIFQMDLMRRKMAGRLSEVFGVQALSVDIANRHLGFAQLADDIVEALPERQQLILDAYARGVNHYLSSVVVKPIELLALNYTPEPWRPQDSLLVSLAMFQLLNENQQDEAMLTSMHRQLPKKLFEFFTPDTDRYTSAALLQGKEARLDSATIPVQALARWIGQTQPSNSDWLRLPAPIPGSNQWVSNNTADGRAILANDMHLPLSVPGLWYHAELRYREVVVKGITLPGLPLIIAGSNQALAWSFTNAQADVLDLVPLTVNPENPRQYRSAEGWRDFTEINETIKIKDAPDYSLKTRRTQWGPVSGQTIMAKPVAVQWSIYQPGAVNMTLMAMASMTDIKTAIDLFNRAGLPPLNVMLADDRGQIAWTLTGKFPKRMGFDGSVAVARDRGGIAWGGFVAAADYPRVINPESGYLMTANNRVLAKTIGFNYGQNFANSYRAYRIKEWLQEHENVTIAQMHQLQNDTHTEFYEFYRQLGLSVITDEVVSEQTQLRAARLALQRWQGRADSDSVGFALIVEYRRQLAKILFSYYLQALRAADKDFQYRWYNQDTPLRALLTQQHPHTLPPEYSDWSQLLITAMHRAIEEFQAHQADVDIATLTWGEWAKINIQHPFGRLHPWLAKWFNMPVEPQSGCQYCVGVANNGNFSASMRMVVSPGVVDDMLLIGVTGQSGNPLSPHYADQYPYWVRGLIPKATARSELHTLLLQP